MHITMRQEQFSRSAIFAIASRAGCAISLRNVDDDSIDLTLHSKMHSRRPAIDVQLKCTSRDVLGETDLSYFLGLKNYEDLRKDDVCAPRILVVMLVPPELDSWLEETEDQILIRHCSYWRSLKDSPATDNATGITVSIPRANRFTVESLHHMMDLVNNGEDL